MAFEHVLAVVPVADIERSNLWYETFFGRPADNNPMPVLHEWRVTDTGWVQVSVDAGRAGTGLLNFAVDDLPAQIAELAGRGLTAEPIDPVNKGVQLSAILDPDGNRITMIGNFRVVY